MKKILITGANSFVGDNVRKWIEKNEPSFLVNTIDMRDENWILHDFTSYDTVFHVAGIAHVSKKKSMEGLYYKVNRDLVLETAKKAKDSGVKQFIFMSSMIVYNSKDKKITSSTKPNPDNFYGLSKLQAEEGLEKLGDANFKVCIVRPPMIYGPGSKGNFPKLARFASKTPIFPRFLNKRSILYIDNLSNVILNLITIGADGIYFPQNNAYFSTYGIVETIAKISNKKIWFTRLFNPFILLGRHILPTLNKMFGDSFYDSDLSNQVIKYNVIDFETSIEKTLSI